MVLTLISVLVWQLSQHSLIVARLMAVVIVTTPLTTREMIDIIMKVIIYVKKQSRIHENATVIPKRVFVTKINCIQIYVGLVVSITERKIA